MAGRQRTVGGTLVLDSEGLIKLSHGNADARAYLDVAIARSARVVTSAVTLAEVMQGGQKDTAVHRVLKRMSILPVTLEIGQAAGELLARCGLRQGAAAHRCTIDAIVAATALRQIRPVVLLTSDPDDMNRLTDEPDQPKDRRIIVQRI